MKETVGREWITITQYRKQKTKHRPMESYFASYSLNEQQHWRISFLLKKHATEVYWLKIIGASCTHQLKGRESN
ncbi:hypothetical protein ERO13_D10G181725v2 [Gossypium hirsutum]|uniref:Uncharacterized protein n=1 Tax=Gossypium darwinii TaxID=34276 RepID=A0A5D2B2E7_GOSDA|nr:hypothetical protein ERO13_D10G181725v2 [Gossypium hirsutum]TYG50979.1 hypothetical protein ES288_D10G219000v1 [Gossypium darwinii]